MRKLFILLSIILLTFQLQASDSTYVTNSDVEKLVDKYTNKIEAGITALAKTLKQPAEYVYQILVKQQYVKAWSSIILTVTGLLFLVITLILAFINDWDTGPFWVFIIVGAIMFIIGFIWFLASGLSEFINPEYKAIQEIINFIK